MDRPKSIGHEIKNLANLIKRLVMEETAKNDLGSLTGMQAWIICYLYNYADKKELFQRDIEKEFNIRRSTATGILQLMEKNGLIIREAVDYDGRLKKITLTARAMDIHQKLIDILIEVENYLRSGLDATEINTFFALMDKLKETLNNR